MNHVLPFWFESELCVSVRLGMALLKEFYQYLEMAVKADALLFAKNARYEEELPEVFLLFCRRRMFIHFHNVLSPHEIYIAKQLRELVRIATSAEAGSADELEVICRLMAFRAHCREKVYEVSKPFLRRGYWQHQDHDGEQLFALASGLGKALTDYRKVEKGPMLCTTHKNIPRKRDYGDDADLNLVDHVLTMMRKLVELGKQLHPLLRNKSSFEAISEAITKTDWLGPGWSRMLTGSLSHLLPDLCSTIKLEIDVGSGAVEPLCDLLKECGEPLKQAPPGTKKQGRNKLLREGLARFVQVFKDGLSSEEGQRLLATLALVRGELLSIENLPESTVNGIIEHGKFGASTLEVQLCEFRQFRKFKACFEENKDKLRPQTLGSHDEQPTKKRQRTGCS